MDKKVVWIDHSGGVKGQKVRARTSKWAFMTLRTPVEIGKADAIANSEAIVVSYQRWSQTGRRVKETKTISFGGHEGRLYNVLHGRENGLTGAAVLDIAGAWALMRKWPFPRPVDRRTNLPLPAESDVMAAMKIIDIDGRPGQRQRVSRTGESLADFGGVLWRRSTEPGWRVGLSDSGNVEVDYARISAYDKPGLFFRLDQREEAEAAAMALAGDNKVKLSSMKIEKLSPEFLSAGDMLTNTISTLEAVVRRVRYAIKSDALAAKLCEGVPEMLDDKWKVGATWAELADEIAAFGWKAHYALCDDEQDYQYASKSTFSPGTLLQSWRDVIQRSVAAGIFPATVGSVSAPDTDDEAFDDFGM